MIAVANEPMQLNMFGDPEPLSSLSQSARLRDDAPVPSERQLLWPDDLADILGAPLLERLYGDLIKRTRLRMDEVCRWMRCDSEHVRRLILAGSLDATDIRHPQATEHAYRIYRYSIVRWAFNRDFVTAESPRCNLNDEDMGRIDRAVDAARKTRRNTCGK